MKTSVCETLLKEPTTMENAEQQALIAVAGRQDKAAIEAAL